MTVRQTNFRLQNHREQILWRIQNHREQIFRIQNHREQIFRIQNHREQILIKNDWKCKSHATFDQEIIHVNKVFEMTVDFRPRLGKGLYAHAKLMSVALFENEKMFAQGPF